MSTTLYLSAGLALALLPASLRAVDVLRIRATTAKAGKHHHEEHIMSTKRYEDQQLRRDVEAIGRRAHPEASRDEAYDYGRQLVGRVAQGLSGAGLDKSMAIGRRRQRAKITGVMLSAPARTFSSGGGSIWR